MSNEYNIGFLPNSLHRYEYRKESLETPNSHFKNIKKNRIHANMNAMNRRFLSTQSALKNKAAEFKSHTESATYKQRMLRQKAREESGITSIPTMSMLQRPLDVNAKRVPIKTGEPLYKMQPVVSAAHAYREARKTGEKTATLIDDVVNDAASKGTVNSSMPSFWTSAIALTAIFMGFGLWQYTRPSMLEARTTKTFTKAHIEAPSVAAPIIVEQPGYSKQPLWLQRPRN